MAADAGNKAGSTHRLSGAVLLALAMLASPPGSLAEPATPPEVGPPAPACHPQVDPAQPQYIVGYGSLMQKESRRRTAPAAGESRPVRVNGVERGWYVRGSATSPATFLGAVANPAARFNAVLYALPVLAEVAATDARESGYCRTALSLQQLEMLDQGERPQGQVWVYTVPAGGSTLADAAHPITQSYVDVFLSGCIEAAEAHGLESFADECVRTTHAWSRHWVNDRIFPRRPFVHQPRAGAIDAMLRRIVPEFLESRVIE